MLYRLFSDMLLIFLTICLKISSICAAAGNEDASSSQKQSIRLFGHDCIVSQESSQPALAQSETMPNDVDNASSHQEESQQHDFADAIQARQKYLLQVDSDVQNRGLRAVLDDVDIKLTPRERQELMQKHLSRYHFNVIDPTTLRLSPIDVTRHRSNCHLVGHEDNMDFYMQDVLNHFSTRHPELSEEKRIEIIERFRKGIEATQKAMKYLHGGTTRGVIHKPSNTIYLSPKVKQRINDPLLETILQMRDHGLLPKLRYGNGRMHFKTSDNTKTRHRAPHLMLAHRLPGVRRLKRKGNGKSMEEETSSEDDL